MAKKNDENKQILIQSFKARQMLYLSGFMTEKESFKVMERLKKYQDKNKIVVSKEELFS
jgi:hypothetical protein